MLRILVVDDYPDYASTLAMLLRVVGHDTRYAENALDALAIADSFEPELVLLDIGLPDMSGYDVARALRATRRPMYLVAITGAGPLFETQSSFRAGFDDHITKPVTYEVLRDVVRSASRRRARRDALTST